jgi:hypothetical protein
MGTGAPVGVRRRGLGLAWEQVAASLAERVPAGEIDRIWLFTPVRQEGREWGTAVILRRLDGERHRVYTATYVIATRGRERGRAKIRIDEVGDSPSVVVEDVISGVRERSGDAEAPTEIAPEAWFPPVEPEVADEAAPPVDDPATRPSPAASEERSHDQD